MRNKKKGEGDPLAIELGRRGGIKTFQKFGSEHYREMQRKRTDSIMKRKKERLLEELKPKEIEVILK